MMPEIPKMTKHTPTVNFIIFADLLLFIPQKFLSICLIYQIIAYNDETPRRRIVSRLVTRGWCASLNEERDYAVCLRGQVLGAECRPLRIGEDDSL